jgi:hypothetical protein
MGAATPSAIAWLITDHGTGRGEPGTVIRSLADVTHQDLTVFQTDHASSSVRKTAESFLRNGGLGGIRLDLVRMNPSDFALRCMLLRTRSW